MKRLLILSIIFFTVPGSNAMQERFMEPEEIVVQEPVVTEQQPIKPEVSAPIIEQQMPTIQMAPQQIQIDQKQRQAIKTLASFLTSKRLIKKFNQFFLRSAKPAKELMRTWFFYCDFHKPQLIKLQEFFTDSHNLAQQAIPIFVKAGMYTLASSQLKTALEAIESGQCDYLHMDLSLEQLEQENPQLHTQIQDLIKQFEQHNEKWQPFFEELLPYIHARMQLAQEDMQQAIKSFTISMIFRNLGPALGLGIEGLIKTRNVDFKNEQSMALLLKEIAESANANKAELEDSLISCAQETLTVYNKAINEALKEAMKRSR
jgi:uncharacterized protein YfaT (DUF1175 family)